MDDSERLVRLEELFQMPEVTSGFPSKQAGLSWANRVAPLLSFNPQYHEPFLHYLQIVTLNVSNYTAAPAFQNMLNQVEMAIEDLKHGLASASRQTASHEPNEQLNKLLRGEGSVAEKTRTARALDDEQLQMAAPHSKYAKEELERRRADRALQAQNRWYTRPVGMVALEIVASLIAAVIYAYFATQ
ncbi:MAG: hypothetical protein HY017_27365 [Betaproteobacteria bacterium]|nr:hypothetical protein [Betaproteobacteria bacterium]